MTKKKPDWAELAQHTATGHNEAYVFAILDVADALREVARALQRPEPYPVKLPPYPPTKPAETYSGAAFSYHMQPRVPPAEKPRVPAPDDPNRSDCTNCGTTNAQCWKRLQRKGGTACCDTCAYTECHPIRGSKK